MVLEGLNRLESQSLYMKRRETPIDTAPPALSHVNCYNCGGQVPITSSERPLSITCPSCGTRGEI